MEWKSLTRSYKKIPIYTDNKGNRTKIKRKANKAVRRAVVVGNHAYFKRLSQSWDICDWSFIEYNPERKWKARRK